MRCEYRGPGGLQVPRARHQAPSSFSAPAVKMHQSKINILAAGACADWVFLQPR
jgi:hypothetical protein